MRYTPVTNANERVIVAQPERDLNFEFVKTNIVNGITAKKVIAVSFDNKAAK